MSVHMDETFAVALRAALVEHVRTSRSPARTRRLRWRGGLAAITALLIAGGGVAFATGIFQLPGSNVVTHLAPAVTFTGTGTHTVDLGTPPPGTTSIDIELTCLSPGTFTTADGASLECGSTDIGATADTMSWQLPVSGLHSTTITATGGARWRLVATYSAISTSPWGVNAHGQTYGVVNAHGTPDLIAVIATNGRTGYAYADQLQRAQPPTPTSPQQAIANNGPHQPTSIPVYASDGRTVIGHFNAG